ncbi:prepilin-type N-terminal cleavage/methylation domain-containing protein [Cellulomonas sp. URHD0024]|uniref:type IV pilus modification PilV family protein n=1 Tax=Cellulomonas sp. URHD0024 TaxID=1302620 RepID=UPI0003FA40CB|nr:type II secretion system protein [Cellulomonas sp. URHD0024]
MSRSLARRATKADGGFSLIELVVAMVILGMMSIAIIGVIMNSQAQGVSNRNRVAAANLAAREIDMVREQFTRDSLQPQLVADAGTQVNPHPLPGQTAGQPLLVDGQKYTVTRTVAWNITGGASTPCDGGGLVSYPTLKVIVSVTWPNMKPAKPVRTSAALAPRKDDSIGGNNGYVAVKVVTAAGLPQPDVNVTVTSPSETKNVVTDTSGCAVAQVAPAVGAGTTYAAKVSNAGYVDLTGNPAPTKAVGLVARGQLNNSVSFAYDAGATLRLRFVDAAGNPVPDAAVVGQTVSIESSVSVGGSSTTALTITGALMDVTNRWPAQYGAYWGTSPTSFVPQTVTAGSTTVFNVVKP